MKRTIALLFALFTGFASMATAATIEPQKNDMVSVFATVGHGTIWGGAAGSAAYDNNFATYGMSIGEHTKLLYLYEGHPRMGGHRDGYAALYVSPIYKGTIDVAWAFGPYYSMNTVIHPVGSEQRNKKGLGGLAQVTFKYNITNTTSILFELNKTKVPDSFSSQWYSFGVDYAFSPRKAGTMFTGDSNWKGYQASVWSGTGNTTRTEGRMSTAYEVEIMKTLKNSNIAISASVLHEGGDRLSNRSGAAMQAWYIAPVNDVLSVSVGAGPYAAYETNSRNRGRHLQGIISTRATIKLTDTHSVSITIHRVPTIYNMDKDIFLFGLIRTIK